MSNKKRKVKNRPPGKTPSRRVISSQQEQRQRRAFQAQSMGNLAFAEAEYRALIAERIASPQLYCWLALICAHTGRSAEAHDLWVKALAIDPRFVEARMNLANSYQQSGRIEQAIKCYRRVLKDHAALVDAKYLLANLLKNQGKFEESADYYEQIMSQKPDYSQAHFSYASIHRYREETDPHIGLMLKQYEQPNLNTQNRIHLAFALAKAHEDLGNYPQAFKFLETGNNLRAKEFNYQIESDSALIQSIIRSFSQEAMSGLQVGSQDSNRPIFIVGMPRSGTTLVERIISSHSDVHAAGELDYMFALGTGLFLKESLNYQFAPIEQYPKNLFEEVGQTYLEKINQLDNSSPRITDKMPFNMMMIGLISIVLPNAKIIHCVRDAKDTCLSIYKQNFTTGNYRFAYNLKTIGQFHNQYRLLMKHWHTVLPGKIYDISYEALTQNPEPEIRRLLSACDLEWQDDCLRFEKNTGTVTTASSFQVRQPMYTSSVRLWEQYRTCLKPLLDELEESP